MIHFFQSQRPVALAESRFQLVALIFTILFHLFNFPSSVRAEKLCLKKRLKVVQNSVKLSKALVRSNETCSKAYSELLDLADFKGEQGDTGPQGPAGVQGAMGNTGLTGMTGSQGIDGVVRIYGDGSAGSKTFATGASNLTDTNLQYTDFTVPTGATVTVESGTVIRCTGTASIEGIIIVSAGPTEGFVVGPIDVGQSLLVLRPNVGGFGSTPSLPEIGDNSDQRFGASGGFGLTALQARNVLRPSINDIGSGGASLGGSAGGDGGAIVILCQTAINIASASGIVANGTAGVGGGGGGAGGIVILGSPGSIDNDGIITAIGGAGGDNTDDSGAGGGGGGGIVHKIAPVISGSGSVSVTAGALGGGDTVVANTPRSGGGGGGSCGGNGGAGQSVEANDSTSGGAAGSIGHDLETVADPGSLFL